MNWIKKQAKAYFSAAITYLMILLWSVPAGLGFMFGALAAHDIFAESVVVTYEDKPIAVYVPFTGIYGVDK